MRYTGETRVRIYGNTAEGQRYLKLATKMMGEVYNQDIKLGQLQQSQRQRVLPNGVIIAVHYNSWVPSVDIFVPPGGLAPKSLVLRSLLKWLPEGFVLTPRSAATSKPWGAPTAGYGELVPDGIFPQVLVNSVKDNFYPDAVFEAVRPATVRTNAFEEITIGFQIAPYAHLAIEREALQMGFKLPEVTKGSPLKQDFWADELIAGPELAEFTGFAHQITVGYDLQIRLPASTELLEADESFGKWYAHRAEFVPFVADREEAQKLLEDFNVQHSVISPTLKDLYDYTNQIREGVGRTPLVPPVRGVYSGAADAIVSEIALSNSYGHDSPEFRDGYRYAHERVITYGGHWNPQYFEVVRTVLPFFAENILFDSSPEPAEGDSLGVYLGKLWESSPTHYAAIVDDWFDEDSEDDSRNTTGVLQLATSQATINNISSSAADPSGAPAAGIDIDNPVSALVGAQIIQGVKSVFQFGRTAWYGETQTLTFEGPSRHVPIPVLHRTDRSQQAGIAFRFDAPMFVVHHRGTPIVLDHVRREDRPELFTQKGSVEAAEIVPDGAKDGGTLVCACLIENEATLIVRAATLWAPEAWETAPILYVADYAVNEVVNSDARLLRTVSRTLPQETCGITGEFSKSGGKLLISVHVREPSTNSFLRFDGDDPYGDIEDFSTAAFTGEAAPGLMYGTSITHMEYVVDTQVWEEFTKQQLTVTAVDVRPLLNESYGTSPGTLDTGNVYHVTCFGEYNAFAAYDGEDIVYTKISVDYEQYQWGGAIGSTPHGQYDFKDKIKLIFADDEETELWLRNFEVVDRYSDLSATEFVGFQLPNADDYVVPTFAHDEKWHQVVGWDYQLMHVDPLDHTKTIRRQVELKGCVATQRSIFGDPDPGWNVGVLSEWDNPANYWRVRQRVLKSVNDDLTDWGTYHEFSAPEHVYADGVYSQDAAGVFVSGTVIATTHSTRTRVTVPTGHPRAGQNVFPNDPQYPRHVASLFSPKPMHVIARRTLLNGLGQVVSGDSAMRAYGHYSFPTASVLASAVANSAGVYPTVDRCAVTHPANISPSLASLAAPTAYTYRLGLEAESASCYEQATSVYNGAYSVAVYSQPVTEGDPNPDGDLYTFVGDVSPPQQARMVRYKDEWLIAGVDDSTVNHVPFRQEKYFFASSLDLPGIVDKGELDDNILPIGIL